MSEELGLEEYMKEDAFLFDKLSKEICQKNKNEENNFADLLKSCENFEKKVILFNIVPTFYVMKTILYFKLNDYENANKYISASLKYLIHVSKNASIQSEKEQKNFEEYKKSVLNQYKILTQDKPEYLNIKSLSFPNTIKFLTSSDESFINEEIKRRISLRK